METQTNHFEQQRQGRKIAGVVFAAIFMLSTLVGLAVLATLVVDVVVKGAPWLDAQFLNGFPSRLTSRAGIKPALVGSLWITVLTALISVPIGIASAIYLEEYAGRNFFWRMVQVNISNLAGVPSVLYGILGLALFVRLLVLGRSVMAGALTMSLLVLPVIIISTQEALRAVPQGIRESAYALGATRWQVIWSHLLPISAPGILTGVILSLSRGIGETAPLIMIGALAFVPFLPKSVMDSFTVLPIQIFNWTSRPQADFQNLAAAGIIVLMIVLLIMNMSAILLRNHFEKKRPR